jgi:hypothetical protein
MAYFKKRTDNLTYDASNQWIGNNPAAQYAQYNNFDRFSNNRALYGPYYWQPTPILGGGNSVIRQLALTAPQIAAPQLITPVAITGDGSNLFAQFGVTPLIDLNNAAPGN